MSEIQRSASRKAGFTRHQTLSARLPKRVSRRQLAEICARWKIVELALFGSVLREDFHDASDIDVLVTFAPGVRYGFAIVQMRDELQELLGRPVDLVTRHQMEQGIPTRCSREILSTARVLYHA